jgi:hypothetical protein
VDKRSGRLAISQLVGRRQRKRPVRSASI